MKSNIVSNWWSMTLSGIIAILYGLLAFYNPGDALTTIIRFIGIVILIAGIAMLIGTINNIKNKRAYIADMLWSVLTIIVGGVLTFYTSQAVIVFVLIIGIWAIIMGTIQLYFVTQIDPDDKSRVTFLINGVLSIVFGIILFFNPFKAATALLVLTGIMAFIIGILLIVLSIKLKGFEKEKGS